MSDASPPITTVTAAAWLRPWREVLIIPDIHQHTRWVEAILAHESDLDGIVFLGDYFDRSPGHAGLASPQETAHFLNHLHQQFGERAVFLLGNHDLQYWEARLRHRAGGRMGAFFYSCGPAWDPACATAFNEILSAELIASFRLFIYLQDSLLSHAGVAPALWKQTGNLEDSLRSLETQCRYALDAAARLELPILAAGTVRGGHQAQGGITWLDWQREFTDTLPCPQIVGHSRDPIGARNCGRSWCIDGNQSCYARLSDGKLTVHSLTI